ncbi:CHAD domain-containing protein [Rhizobium mesoamericanum]|uniref:Putative adenylate cyclase-associated protein (CHAD domain) n=1 Tax=Rhizobium mesoamericanum STM3625 TaxID=1211777 RepID=K0PLM3_9HYPH|nr:CHAD domain-containing protein [Rhizobium mesoamericanum]CCM77356.1 putative adenylate cyclase-associated protein (CHAD domain) [Rhizobium mesoamericanum STM3625]
MPFQIRPDRSFTEEFRKAIGEQLWLAIHTLEEMPEGKHEAIHDFRKNLKRVRSLYRLVAEEIPEIQEQENARLREIAQSLSTIRDAAALIETAAHLKAKARNGDEKRALGRIIEVLKVRRDHMAAAEATIDRKLTEAPDCLKEAAAAVEDVHFNGGPRRHARLVAKGWRRTALKAREAIVQCRNGQSAEAFHTLRKRAQDYRAYHVALRPLWPAAMDAKYEVTSSLVDLLGRIHDLDVLCELVEAEPRHFTNADDLAHLLDAIIFHQQKGRQAALERAEEVFADDPQEEADRIELLWHAQVS